MLNNKKSKKIFYVWVRDLISLPGLEGSGVSGSFFVCTFWKGVTLPASRVCLWGNS